MLAITDAEEEVMEKDATDETTRSAMERLLFASTM